MDALPDALLGRIFAAAGRQAGPSITSVSRRWRGVFYAEPSLWHTLTLAAEAMMDAEAEGMAGDWFATKARLLQRSGSFVQHMHYIQLIDTGGVNKEVLDMQRLAAEGGFDWRLGSSVLARLSPASLHGLRFEGEAVDTAAAAELRRLTNLTRLKVSCREVLSGSFVAALPHLQQLQTLGLSGSNFPAGLAEALQHLPRLRALHCNGDAPTLDLAALLPLSQLRELWWFEMQRASKLQVDVQQLLACMPLLESWSISSYSRRSGVAQTWDAVLGSLGVVDCMKAQRSVRRVGLYDIRRMPSLQQLLVAVLPAGAQPSWLRSLKVSRGTLSQQALQGCSFLSHLTRIKLSYCKFAAGETEAVVQALLQQALRLQSLALPGSLRRQPLPLALLQRTGLLHLDLRHNKLADLDSGPYLNSLVSLDLSENKWTCVPPALEDATNLTELSLGRCPDLVLSEGDVETLLCLPRLRRLYLDAPKTSIKILSHLTYCAPVLEVSRHKLQPLPSPSQGQE